MPSASFEQNSNRAGSRIMGSGTTENMFDMARPATVMVGLVLIVASGLIGCTDEEVDSENDDVNDNDVTDVGDPDPDANDNQDNQGDQDTGPDEDANDEPDPTCEELECDDGETCYHGACYDVCDSDLDCSGDNTICNTGRCVDVDCGDVSCDEGMECFRGRCYDDCNSSSDCGAGGGITCENDDDGPGACVPLDDQCEGIECLQVNCPTGDSTTVTGTVHTPSGDYPLPNVTVYVPQDDLEPLPEGATCAPCEELITGDPLTQTITDADGDFELPNFPVAEDVSLVVQTGKWRREVTIDDLDPCATNDLDDELTRLPKNQSEGNLPRIAVATGGCDAMSCLVRNVGIDDDEFTTEDGDGAVNIFQGGGGGSSFSSGESFSDASVFWNDGSKMEEYDIFLDSCDCSETLSDKPDLAMLSFPQFLRSGGRAFMSHFQYVWLKYGSDEMQSVADWNDSTFGGSSGIVEVDTSHSEGQEMEDWLNGVGALDGSGQMSLTDDRYSVDTIDESVAKTWLWYPAEEAPAYFSFNMPLGTEGDDACGRAVFSDLHVASGSASNFPSGCGGGGALSNQEQALLYMVFDLSACIAPECEPIECEDVKGQCGIHADECGGTIECGECCTGFEEPCEEDNECCDDFVCSDDEGLCLPD